MKKTMAVLLVLAAILLAVAPLFAAGLSAGDWPKVRRDAGNRACSPATAVAKPIIQWRADTFGHGVTMSNGNAMGPILDANNVYVVDEGNGPNGDTMAFKRDGSYLWTGKDSTGAEVWMAPINYWNWGGPALFNDGVKDYVLVGPGATLPSSTGLFWLNSATGAQPNATYGYGGFTAPTSDYVSPECPAIGPDGTVYEVVSNETNWLAGTPGGGTIYAIDGLTHTLKWSWGATTSFTPAAGQPAPASLSFHTDPLCIATVGGKTVVIVATWCDDITVDPNPNVYALQDDGTSCTVLWSKRMAPSYWAPPALSNDGQTVYITTLQWQSPSNKTLFALDVATGAEKWSVNPHAELSSGPAVGADGTIYVTSTWRQNDRTDVSGKLIAIKDNGTSAAIMWTMFVDYEQDSHFSSPVVNSGTPATIYFGSTSGRTFAVQDLGSTYKIIWSKALPGTGVHSWPIPIIANDGHVYIHQGRYIYAFATGLDGPVGITGVVTDAGGIPIANAFVAASTGSFPLTDSATKYYAKTDPNGRYAIVVPAGTYNVAAWISGRVSSDLKSVNLATDAGTATADFALRVAGANLCTGKTITASSTKAGSNPAAVIDGNLGTRWESANGATAAAPQWLMVDLGSDKTIGEAVMYWEAAYATTYSIQYLKDGSDPAVEANWTNTVFSTTTGAGGVPINWITWAPVGATSTFGSIAKWVPVSARYWRINATASRYTGVVSIYEFQLRSGMPPGPVSGKCADVRKLDNGQDVIIEGKRVTAAPGAGVPAGVVYVEDAERTGAIRVQANLPTGTGAVGTGDIVTVSGTVATTAAGEKYVDGAVNKVSGALPLVALGMNNTAAAGVKAQGMFVKVWGKVSAGDATSFNITDGSATPIKVMCGSLTQPAPGSTIRVRGVMSVDASGPILLMRNEQLDWTSADATFQPLPFPGAYKYPREYLICGPFANAQSATDPDYRLDNDFLSDASGGLVTELNVNAKAGDMVGGKVWKKAACTANGGEAIDFIANYPTNNTNCTFYALLYVWSPVSREIAMRAGSDDGLRVISVDNGFDVCGSRTLRGVTIGEDLGTYVPLQAGLSRLLFKVSQGGGGSGLNCQFVSQETPGNAGYGNATPLEGLGYMLAPTP